MIHPPQEWPRTVGEHRLTLYPPGGGRIRYHERLPVRSLVDTARDLAVADERFAAVSPSPPRRLVTDEGEYAGWTTLRGGGAVRIVAAVITDEFVAALEGLAESAAEEAVVERAVRDLLREARFGLGLRRRRMSYRPPPGWSALPNGLVATWYPPRFPGERARIVVYPAHPSSDDAVAALDAIVADEAAAGFALSGAIEVLPARSDHGLAGIRARLAGEWRSEPGRVSRDLVVYSDGRYSYPLWFEAAPGSGEARRPIFDDIARSVEPLPRAGGRAGGDTLADVSSPWQE